MKLPEVFKTPSADFPYRLDESPVGEGAMGIVFRAIEPALNRPVAVKFLHPRILEDHNPQVAREMRQRFVQEAQAAAALSRPGVVTVYRIGELEKLPFIAMEWLDGQSLEAALQSRGSFSIAETIRIGGELLDVLGAAHDAGIVHRDIKPSNLMLLSDGRVKVTDFGIAKVRDSDLVKTQAGTVLATVPYASPEQFGTEGVDERSDLFSAGMLLYVLLSGRHPFAGQSVVTLINSVLRVEPPALHEVNSEVPLALSAVVHKALRKNREQRFSSASEMARALRTSAAAPVASVEPALGPVARESTTISRFEGPLSVAGLPKSPIEAAASVLERWPLQPLGAQEVDRFLQRLAEPPLHGTPFSGAVRLATAWLLFHEGDLVGAFDTITCRTGDAAVESLPPSAEISIANVPARLPARTPLLLSLLVEPGRTLHRGLDSKFVNLPALSRELAGERLDGIVRLVRGTARTEILLSEGQPVLQLFSGDWSSVPLERSWTEWVSDLSLKADVETVDRRILAPWLRYRLRNIEVGLRPAEKRESKGTGGSTAAFFGRVLGHKPSGHSSGVQLEILRPRGAEESTSVSALELAAASQDPAWRFLEWLGSKSARFFRERNRSDRWKYLVDWVPLVRRAILHHDLPRPKARETDFFDLVTFDEKGKALLLAHRSSRGSLAELDRFIEHVKAAKSARTETGDIGAACLLAPRFDREALEAYGNGKHSGGPSPWEMGLSESVTRYEAFVRMGPTRGFHLLLVEDHGNEVTPVLPDVAAE